mmetsp:Transcript_12784/g.38564  ORF Transcript_12784/g.38564 Transcript_12784/m.38564 type:complete len:901 (+) Transcript_12784:224-2926(+)
MPASLFADLEKATVLQECRAFSDSKIVTESPRRCSQLITKLLHIVTQGDCMSSSEVTEVFFGVTKLFQSPDASLRRMVYFFIKEVAETCNPDDVIIVTSSLTKDMNSNEDLFRSNSIRVLAKMIDATMLGAIERYLKQAIVDKNAMVASSALVAGLHLVITSADVVRRWVNEVQEALHCSADMVQFHALSLLYEIKRHDKLAISKMVVQLARASVSSPLATCLLIRYIAQILLRDGEDCIASQTGRAAYQFLELSLKHRSEAVIYEAAKALCSLPRIEDRDLGPAVAVLQLLLSSPKATLRLASMRALSTVAMAKPSAVTKCNDDMESLIADNNRSIATFAITTLLKTGSESSVDRLMKQISSFMNEIADEFKVVVVTAIRELCLKYPLKHRVLVGFLANFLREEGGFEFKKSIVEAIVILMGAIPETKESSLFHLCEFIEDCEFTALSTQILHLVGSLGPTTSAPARYIRFIYNRIILENAIVRAAAVMALSKFAVLVPSLCVSVSVLLRRSLCDEDDEVRDRAVIALRLIGTNHEAKSPQGLERDDVEANVSDAGISCDMLQHFYGPPKVSFDRLAYVLEQATVSDLLNDSNSALSYETLPQTIEDHSSCLHEVSSLRSAEPGIAALNNTGADVYKVPEIAKLGAIFKSSRPSELTESETEYVVKYTKHVFNEYISLQFSVTNTIPDQLLCNVGAHLHSSDGLDVYEVVDSISIRTLPYGSTAEAWLVLRPAKDSFLGMPAHYVAELQFRVVEVEPTTGEIEGDKDGFAEEYPLEDIEITPADFLRIVETGLFRDEWESLPRSLEIQHKYALQFKDMGSAIAAVSSLIGMQPIDNTDLPENGLGVLQHTLHFAGDFVQNTRVLARMQILIDPSTGCTLKIAVRSQNQDISQLIADSIK